MKNTEPESFLNTAARAMGHAAGKAAKVLNLDEIESSNAAKAPPKSAIEPKSRKRVTMRSKRIAQAAAAKMAAPGLKDSATARNLRYRRIMGKAPSAWSQADIDYIEGLKSAEKQKASA
jgi:hypothetical protein